MVDESKDAGLIQVLAARLESQRLPRALSLKEKVDQGDTLDDYDISFLEEAFVDARKAQPLVERHPEWEALATKIIHLYKEITEKALENEKQK